MDETASPPPTPKNPDPNRTAAQSSAETCYFSAADAGDQVERDVALAAELLGSGMLSERQVHAAMADWSIHGTTPLSDHLKSTGLVSTQQLDELNKRTIVALERAKATHSGAGPQLTAGQSSLTTALDRIDGSGKVAKLLGVSAATMISGDELRQSPVRYQLVRKLGQGGLGRVWLARDLNLQRHVALKEISRSNPGEAVLKRFRYEAEITGRLEHPGIVPAYQLGEDVETGQAFYTMRFLGKSTLQDSISEYHERRDEGDDDPMLLRHLLAAFVNVCHAIGHAHSRSVIHRDLKPENIVIDSFGQVIVIDWGLAKVLDETGAEPTSASVLGNYGAGTQDGQVLGTPLYMAPEQAAGRLDEIDQRTDIYGLGAILFAILTGSAPHELTQAASVQSGIGMRGMLGAITSEPTPNAAAVNPSVDPALAAVCGKAMARRRYARYQSASNLAEEVQRWMAGEPVVAYRESTWHRARRWVDRNQRLSQVAASLIAVALAAGAALAVSARQNHLAAAQSQFEDMRSDAREIELHLRNKARDIAVDVRFMSVLPPIQGIVNARAGIEGDDEQVWITRLDTIYAGLLRANEMYLAVSYLAVVPGAAVEGPADQATDSIGSQAIVSLERNPSDHGYIRTVPTSRLASTDSDPLMQDVANLQPGDVRLAVDAGGDAAKGGVGVRRLTAAVPVFSEQTGAVFGMVTIESDLADEIVASLRELGNIHCDIFVTDGSGAVLAMATPTQGISIGANGTNVVDIVPESAALFEAKGREEATTDDETFYARRFAVDPKGSGVGIVVRLPEEE